jgi:hypothetical protein
MQNQRDIIAQNIKILNDKEVSIIINNEDEDYIFSALTVEGGGVFKKGLSIGIQEKMVPGLMIYDQENFYGFSEKYGLSLLSTHPEYNQLNLPENIFEIKANKNTLQPVQKNSSEHFQNLKETEKNENKRLNIDLEIKDINNFFIIIPKDYSLTKFSLTFDIRYIFDLNSIISNLSLILINESDKLAYFNIMNNNCYYENNFNNTVEKNSITKIYLEVINSNYFIISKKSFTKFP